jgi:GT2 family glycosyltransferase
LSVLIVNYNTVELIAPMMEGLFSSVQSVGDVQIIVVDNGSKDGSVELLRSLGDQIELVCNVDNVGFGRANNQCLPAVRGSYVLLLNTDAFIGSDALNKTLCYMVAHPNCGVLGVRLVGRDGSLQPSCRYFPTVFNVFLSSAGISGWFPWVRVVDDLVWDHSTERDCDWVPGCYYLVRREVLDDVGLFDPRFFLYYEEVDHCRAVKAAGWSVTYFAGVNIVHIGGESAKSNGDFTSSSRQISALQIESELLYFRKHSGLSGLLTHLMLTIVAALILTAKALVRLRGTDHIASLWRHVIQVMSFAQRTGFGARPTR